MDVDIRVEDGMVLRLLFLYISNYTKLPTVASVAADDVLLDVAVGGREREGKLK